MIRFVYPVGEKWVFLVGAFPLLYLPRLDKIKESKSTLKIHAYGDRYATPCAYDTRKAYGSDPLQSQKRRQCPILPVPPITSRIP